MSSTLYPVAIDTLYPHPHQHQHHLHHLPSNSTTRTTEGTKRPRSDMAMCYDYPSISCKRSRKPSTSPTSAAISVLTTPDNDTVVLPTYQSHQRPPQQRQQQQHLQHSYLPPPLYPPHTTNSSTNNYNNNNIKTSNNVHIYSYSLSHQPRQYQLIREEASPPRALAAITEHTAPPSQLYHPPPHHNYNHFNQNNHYVHPQTYSTTQSNRTIAPTMANTYHHQQLQQQQQRQNTYQYRQLQPDPDPDPDPNLYNTYHNSQTNYHRNHNHYTGTTATTTTITTATSTTNNNNYAYPISAGVDIDQHIDSNIPGPLPPPPPPSPSPSPLASVPPLYLRSSAAAAGTIPAVSSKLPSNSYSYTQNHQPYAPNNNTNLTLTQFYQARLSIASSTSTAPYPPTAVNSSNTNNKNSNVLKPHPHQIVQSSTTPRQPHYNNHLSTRQSTQHTKTINKNSTILPISPRFITDSPLRAATHDSFHPCVTWTDRTLIQVLTYELEDMCFSNAQALACAPSPTSDFHPFFSQSRQPFNLDFYVHRLVTSANCSAASFIVMLTYIDRAQQASKSLLLNDMNIHRVLLAALVLAIKYVDDEVFSNAHYACVGGVDVNEMNKLESKLLNTLDWNLFVPPDVFRLYESGLLQWSDHLISTASSPSPFQTPVQQQHQQLNNHHANLPLSPAPLS